MINVSPASRQMLAVFFIAFSGAAAQAATLNVDPLTAARISLAALQNVLASPPLPTLRTKEGRAVLFQGGYSSGNVQIEGQDQYTGMLEGGTLGIGYTGRAERGFAFFGTLLANNLEGALILNLPSATDDIRFNMSVQGFAGLGGGSWRLLGDNGSFAAFGVFAGPMFAKLTSKVDVTGTAYKDSFESSPSLWGGLGGAQIEIRPGNFLVKPYLMYFVDLSDPCKEYDGPSMPDGECKDAQKLPLKGSFAAYGLNVGYRGFKVNVLSQVFNDSSLASFEVHNYQISYTRGFD